MPLSAAACFPCKRHINAGVRCALGTDVGGGTGFGMLKEGLQAYLLQRIAPDGMLLDAGHLLYLATLAGAEALGLSNETGDFRTGKSADFVYLRPPADSPLAAVLEREQSSGAHAGRDLYACRRGERARSARGGFRCLSLCRSGGAMTIAELNRAGSKQVSSRPSAGSSNILRGWPIAPSMPGRSPTVDALHARDDGTSGARHVRRETGSIEGASGSGRAGAPEPGFHRRSRQARAWTA